MPMNKFHFLRHSEVAKNVDFDLQQLKSDGFDDLALLFKLYYSLEFALGQEFADANDRYYPNASFSVLRFITKIRSILRMCGRGARFLDVGCGLGNKVWIAQAIGFDAYGLEINQKYAKIAAQCVGTNRILLQDGITFPHYGHYDVIYFYNPMPAHDLEAAIVTNAKKGAIIYHAIGLQAQPDRAFVRLSNRVLRLTDEAPTSSLKSCGNQYVEPPEACTFNAEESTGVTRHCRRVGACSTSMAKCSGKATPPLPRRRSQ